MIELILAAVQYMVVLPGGTREMWDKDPAGKVPAGAQICTWSPKADEPKDPYLYVRHHSGAAVYQKPAEVVDTSPQPVEFLRKCAEDAAFPQEAFTAAQRLSQVRGDRKAVWNAISKDLSDEAKAAIRDAATATNMGIE